MPFLIATKDLVCDRTNGQVYSRECWRKGGTSGEAYLGNLRTGPLICIEKEGKSQWESIQDVLMGRSELITEDASTKE